MKTRRLGGLPMHPALNNPDPLLNYRLGVEDPLRLPDAIMDPSAATVLRSEYTISSDAAGHAVFGENHNLLAASGTVPVTAGTTGALVSTAHPQAAAFYSEAAIARMVGMKVQVLYIGAEATNAGYLSYVEKVSTTGLATVTLDSLHTGAQAQNRAEEGLIVHVDYTQEPRYEAANGGTFMSGTFPAALFIASGLPVSTPVFRVRVLRFMEYIPAEGALAEGETRHEPPNIGAMAAHGALSGVSTSVTTVKEGPTFFAKVKSVANAAYHMAQPMLPYVANQARQFLVDNAPRIGGAVLALSM